MLDFAPQIADAREFYTRQGTDAPHTLMGFRGEFNFSDHSLVPEIIQTYVLYTTKYERFRQVPLDLVNQMAREIHGGEPGVPLRILDRIAAVKLDRQQKILAEANDNNTYTPEHSIDDWSNYGEAPSTEREERTTDVD